MNRKIIALSLGIFMAVSSFPFAVFAEEEPASFVLSGSCGDNAFWGIDDVDGEHTLYIYGSGDMYDYGDPFEENTVVAPWLDTEYYISSVVIEDGITSTGEFTFSGLDYFDNLTVASSVVRIAPYSFSGCEDLEVVTFGSDSKLELIEEGAFGDCISLEKFPFDKTTELSIIGDLSFCFADFRSVKIPKKVSYIGENAFKQCDLLESVSFESDNVLASIGDGAFEETQIRSITIPSGVAFLGPAAFKYCDCLTQVMFEDNSKITTLGEGTFEGCESLRSIDLKGCSNLTVIEDNAFSECIDLESVILPDCLTTIGDKVFRDCSSLETIVIPASVTSFGNQKSYVDTYMEIYCYAKADDISWDIGSEEGTFVIHVLSTEVDAYKARIGDDSDTTVIGDLVDIDSGIVLAGHSLSLDGFIGVNFYMELDSSIADSDDAYMLFTLPGNGNTQKVNVSDAKKDTTAIPGKTFYIFSCKVAAKQMTDQIKAQVYLTDNVPAGNEYTYSVVEYANYIVDHRDSYDQKVFAVVAGMLAYGGFSQLYFKYNTGHLAYDSMVSFDGYLDGILDVDANKISRIVSAADTEVDGNIVFKSVNLELESEMTMNFYFENVPDGTVFKLNGKELPSVKNASGLIVVTISGIPAHLIGSGYTVTLWSGDTELGSVTYSPMNYCYNVLSRETTETRTADLKNLIKAIYLYYKTADYYNS